MMHLNAQFEKCDALLTTHRIWWQFRAFHHRDYPWQTPELHQALDALCDEEVAQLQGDHPALARFLSPWIADVEALVEYSRLPQADFRALHLSSRQQNSIPGKKLKQISAFAQTVPDVPNLVEWCAGKSHLGRILAGEERKVTAVEISPELCEEGKKLGKKIGVDIEFICTDVLRDDVKALFAKTSYAVALHACGDLHQKLILMHEQLSGLSIAPCCYHLTHDECYHPLSALGQASALQLGKQDLSLCLQETVTACAKMPEMNNQEVVWRLAFDCLQRDLLGCDEYLPLPNIQKSQLKKSFAEFVDWALAQKKINSPSMIDLDAYLMLGQKRLLKTRRMELVQQLFKRPIEIWLLMDKAFFLQGQGFDVSLFEFCDKSITPRNVCIQATRKGA